MSIPIEDVRPGWYWITILTTSGDELLIIVCVSGKSPFMEITFGSTRTNYRYGNIKFIQRIEPPKEGE